MTILLQNLLARAPKMNDLESVINLLQACDSIEGGVSDYTEEQVRSDWQRNGFNLECDAWAIVTRKGEFVGYASVCADEDGRIEMTVRVHPRSQKRGIGTLLVRLAEQRARSLISKMPSDIQVLLQSSVSHSNSAARELLEHEGYTSMRSFWRIMIDMDETLDEFSQQSSGILSIDVMGHSPNLLEIVQLQKRTGIYLARQYDIYEKVLRRGSEDDMCNEMVLEPVGV